MRATHSRSAVLTAGRYPSDRIMRAAGFTAVNVGELVKTKNLHGGKHEDEELDCTQPQLRPPSAESCNHSQPC